MIKQAIPSLSELVRFDVKCPLCNSVNFLFYHDEKKKKFVCTCVCKHQFFVTKSGVK
jgi:hypothetical protein